MHVRFFICRDIQFFIEKNIDNDRGVKRREAASVFTPASLTAFKRRMYGRQLEPRRVLRPQINID